MRWLLLFVALLGASATIAASPCDTRAPTAMADLAEVRLTYQSIGRDSDPALLLVMGLGGQLIDWPDEVLGSLCQAGWRVIRFDNRDVGLSRLKGEEPEASLTYAAIRYRLGLPVEAPYHLRDMAADGLQLMDQLGIEQFHLLGASMGGMIAQHMADLAPERVRSLTLLMTSSSAQGLPAPRAQLLELLARREAPNRQVALEQQADLLAALGSLRCRMTVPRCCVRRHAATTALTTRRASSASYWPCWPNPVGSSCSTACAYRPWWCTAPPIPCCR